MNIMNYELTCVHLKESIEESYTCTIYLDDTIDHVKSKISALFPTKNIDEYYLFMKEKKTLNPYDSYKLLSSQNTRTITYELFSSFCLNHSFPLPPRKDEYELDDFLALETEVFVNVPIGISHSPFVVNPFQNTWNQQEDSGTTSRSLWLSMPTPENNTVYICFAKEVFDYSTRNQLEISKVFNVYYPYLFKEDRLHPERFVDKKSSYEDYNDLMDFHHSIYKPDMILSHGIVSLYFVMYTLQPFHFPLDIFFKLFNSSANCPYIKLHGQKSNENVYRFYCDQVNENGYPIPMLRKKAIIKYSHEINKNSISYVFPDKEMPVYLVLDKKGHLYFRLDHVPFLTVEEIETFLMITIQPFIESLFEFFDPSRKIFTFFESLQQANISILDMKYRCQYKKEGKLNIKKYMSCFSPLFNFMNEKEKITLRYKRVSNYNESQSKDAYLIEAFNQNISIEEMIHVFSSNFMKHDEKAAAEYVHQFFSTLEIEEKQNNLKKVKINPGFLVEIEKSEYLDATVHSIDHIGYIPYVKLYLTNLILISQGIVSDEGRCKKIKEVIVQEIKTIRAEEPLNLFEEEVEEMPNLDKNHEFDFNQPLDTPLESPENDTLRVPINSPEKNVSLNSPLNLPQDSPESQKESVSLNSPLNVPINSPEKNVTLNSPLNVPENSPESQKESVSLNSPLNVPENSPESQKESVSLNSPLNVPLDSPESQKESISLNSPLNVPLDSPESQKESVSLNSPLNLPQDSPEESQKESVSLNSPLNVPEDSPLNLPENSPEESIPRRTRMSGGSFALDKTYEVFIYDIDPYSLQKRLEKRLKRDPIREAMIVHYFRAFQGEECTLVQKEQEICKGYIFEMSGEEMKDYSNGEWIRIEYLDRPGNTYDGYTYIRKPKEWTDHPVVQFVKKVYAAVSYGWDRKQDNKDEMYIYDIHNELKARYNGKYYVRLDEAEELTKIQFTPVNPLLKRLQDREPTLFTKTDSVHNQYSRMCLWSEKRQPIILTKEEKERIDQIAPGSYESAIEYSTDPKKPYFYICPKYWDLKNNVPVSPDKVDPSKLISRDASDSDKQKHIQSRYILELAKPGDKPVYQTRVGFLTKKHPSGYYMPCCFISKPKKDKPDAIDKRIQEALQYYERKPDPPEKASDYIQNGDKFPLTDNRKGHLPPILEKFFNVRYSDCYSQLQKRKLKINYPCLLRQGVRDDQPFLSSLSFLYFKKSQPTSKIIKVILEKISLDTIQTFHNGGIVHTFSKDYSEQDVSAYKDTELYRKMDHESLKRIVNGYENFRKYLMSNDFIDYTYLWDIITMVLFNKRVNLIILKEGLEDVTHNLHIVCPTTAHAIYSFHEDYPSLLIYQRGDLFEPLFVFKKMETEEKTITLFDLKDNLSSVNDALQKIYSRIGPSCREKTIHSTYTFRENLYLDELLDELENTPYKVNHTIMNIDGRIFGVLLTQGSFIPCRPSAVNGRYEMVDDSIWQDYNTTVQGLRKIAKESRGAIPCAPKIRVLESQMVVGILTETNQFIPLKAPEENKMRDDLSTIDEENRLKVEEQIQKGMFDPKDKMIQSLKLEQLFYNAFFNTLKVELNDSSNITLRKKLEATIRSKNKKEMENILEPLLEKKFIFVDDYAIDVYELTHVNLCKHNEPYCEEGKLLIPRINLFHQGDNSIMYLNRFMEDVMMNTYVQRTLLEEIHSTLYYTDRYTLSDHEILLLESELLAYLEKEPVRKIQSAHYPLLEDVTPNKILEYIDHVEPQEENEKIQLESEESEESDEDLDEPLEEMKENLKEDFKEEAEDRKDPNEKEKSIEKEIEQLENELRELEEKELEENDVEDIEDKVIEEKEVTEKEVTEREESPEVIDSESDDSDTEPKRVLGTSLNGPKVKKLNMKHIQEEIIPCIKTFYFKKNSKWKLYFPPKTIGYRIMKGDTYDTAITDVKCNFIMALQILKDYQQKYVNLNIRELKDLLIDGYNHLSDSLPMLKKFKKEKKRYKKFEDIQSEHYPFTELDLLVLMVECKLPLVVFIQAKNKLKLITYHTQDHFKYYIKMKKKDTFMLFIYEHSFKIDRSHMDALYEAERDNVYLSDPEQRTEFFEHY